MEFDINKSDYIEMQDLPKELFFIYLDEEKNRWENRKLALTSGSPFIDGWVIAVAASCIAIPFLNFHGESIEKSGPIIGMFWIGGWIVSRFRHYAWQKNYDIEESAARSAFIQRANQGEFEDITNLN